MRIIVTLFITMLMTVVCYAATEIQYDGSGSYTIVKPHQYIDTNGSEGYDLKSVFNAKRSINENLELSINHRFNGSNNIGLYPEKNLPIDNTINSGLRITGFGALDLNITNELFVDADALSVPYYMAGTEIIPQMLTYGEGEWGGEFEWFHCDMKLYSSVYNFELRPQSKFVMRSVIESEPYGKKRDIDIWADVSAGVDIPLDLGINAGYIKKDDLTKETAYDIDKLWLGIGGDHQLNRKKVMLSWNAQEEFIKNKIMEDNGYADGLTSDIMMRLVWRKSSDFFVKGQLNVDLAAKLFKQYYEVQLRKTWKEGSSFDVLYFATNGVLFPRQSIALNSTIRLFEHFGINPSVALYMSQLPRETSFRYYRSDYKLELLFPVNQRFDFYTGYNLTHYDRHPVFATRNSICAGIRTW